MFPEVEKQESIELNNRETLIGNTMFPQQYSRVEQLGNIDRKRNVSATMFPGVDKQRDIDFNNNTSYFTVF